MIGLRGAAVVVALKGDPAVANDQDAAYRRHAVTGVGVQTLQGARVEADRLRSRRLPVGGWPVVACERLSHVACPSSPGAYLTERFLVVTQDGAPIVAPGHDVEIVDQEAHERFERDAPGRQVELVKRQGLTVAVGVEVRPVRVISHFAGCPDASAMQRSGRRSHQRAS